jgi:hypothetical protein
VNVAEVIQALGETPRRITVKCPAGHFITDMTVCVIAGAMTAAELPPVSIGLDAIATGFGGLDTLLNGLIGAG